MSRRTLLQELG